jgi:formylglycine-generating enzyme required for sulfatase activity
METIAERAGWDLERGQIDYPCPFGPQRRVILSKPFFLGITEVTIGQYLAVAAALNNPTAAKPPNNYDVRRPKQFTVWEAAEFVRDQGIVQGLPPRFRIQRDLDRITIPAQEAATYRLPTMAEWEYAARAGTTGAHWMLDLESQDRKQGITTVQDKILRSEMIYENSKQTQLVGSGLPNPFGLWDMVGNVKELCEGGASINFFGRDLPEPWVDPYISDVRHLTAKGAAYNTEASLLHVSTYQCFRELYYGNGVRLVLDVDAALDLRERKALRVGVGP